MLISGEFGKPTSWSSQNAKHKANNKYMNILIFFFKFSIKNKYL